MSQFEFIPYPAPGMPNSRMLQYSVTHEVPDRTPVSRMSDRWRTHPDKFRIKKLPLLDNEGNFVLFTKEEVYAANYGVEKVPAFRVSKAMANPDELRTTEQLAEGYREFEALWDRQAQGVSGSSNPHARRAYDAYEAMRKNNPNPTYSGMRAEQVIWDDLADSEEFAKMRRTWNEHMKTQWSDAFTKGTGSKK